MTSLKSFVHQHKVLAVLLVLLVMIAALCVNYFCDPSTSRIALICPFKEVTGWDCPGCGGQRALHALLHGDFERAFRFNPFLIIGFPMIVLAFLTEGFHTRWTSWLKKHIVTQKFLYAYIVLTFAWWIGRNIWWEMPQ